MYTIIIPAHNLSDERVKLLQWTYIRLSQLVYTDKAEILLVDCEGEYNRAAIINKGAKKAKFDNLLIIESDVVFSQNHLDFYKEHMYDPYCIPRKLGLRLGASDTQRILKLWYNDDLSSFIPSVGDIEYIQGSNLGLCFGIQKSILKEVGFFDERFKLDCPEDQAHYIMLKTIYGQHAWCNHNIYHLYHKHFPSERKYDNILLPLFDEYRKRAGNKDEMIKFIKEKNV